MFYNFEKKKNILRDIGIEPENSWKMNHNSVLPMGSFVIHVGLTD